MKTRILVLMLSLSLSCALLLMARRDNVPYSLDVRHAVVGKDRFDVVCVFSNNTREDVSVIDAGSRKFSVYFLNDGRWMLCSSKSDICDTAKGDDLVVKSGESISLAGSIPRECMRTKWYIILGIRTKNAYAIDRLITSPVYSTTVGENGIVILKEALGWRARPL